MITLISHELVNRVNGPGKHHGQGAHFEALQDVGMFFGPIGGDTGIDRLVVVALVGFHNHVVALGCIESVHDLFQGFTAGPPHGMPPMNFNGLREDLIGSENRQNHQYHQHHEFFHHGCTLLLTET